MNYLSYSVGNEFVPIVADQSLWVILNVLPASIESSVTLGDRSSKLEAERFDRAGFAEMLAPQPLDPFLQKK